MKTLPQLLSRVDAERMQNSKYVKLEKTKAGYTQTGEAFVAAVTYSARRVNADGKIIAVTKPTKYLTTIVFIDKHLHCKVSCSCSDFLYRLEVALNRKDAADIEYSNGALPVITNPRMIPFLCKHLTALAKRVEPELTKAKSKIK